MPLPTSTPTPIRHLQGDLNGDCAVDILDWQIIAPRFGCVWGRLCYSRTYDLEPPGGDEDIDIFDLQYVCGRMGSTCANPYPPQ